MKYLTLFFIIILFLNINCAYTQDNNIFNDYTAIYNLGDRVFILKNMELFNITNNKKDFMLKNDNLVNNFNYTTSLFLKDNDLYFEQYFYSGDMEEGIYKYFIFDMKNNKFKSISKKDVDGINFKEPLFYLNNNNLFSQKCLIMYYDYKTLFNYCNSGNNKKYESIEDIIENLFGGFGLNGDVVYLEKVDINMIYKACNDKKLKTIDEFCSIKNK